MTINHPVFSDKKRTYKGSFFLTGFHRTKRQFFAGFFKNGEIIEAGSFSEGLTEEEKSALINSLMKQVPRKTKKQKIAIKPSLCVELTFSGFSRNKLLHPKFSKFQLKDHPESCTWSNLIIKNLSISDSVQVTNHDKRLWETPPINKDQYVAYLSEIAERMLPFLQERTVTVKRAPQGVKDEVFYQKNCPEYAPPFVNTYHTDETDYIVCDNVSTLLWLGNQASIEFHIPFNTVKSENPGEIVFDLDPPGREHFSLAIKASRLMKERLDAFNITSFPKLSGNKGLQIHIPFFNRSLTYEDTRIFTSFMANYLTEKYSKDFTTERMKKKRGNKLYIDYVQHWRGKTIICPYSLRINEDATVAAPLNWNEVNENLNPIDYDLFSVLARVRKKQCPLKKYFKTKNESVAEVIDMLKKNGHK
ncbi:DNA ligase D [Bacillus shivajii]|uniref:DNA ligase D n=1 Tax=Bacillus shivajii TaxID=1983719 RepID=UPI001CF9F007|nr:DNA ligase D [Bacillus shivajii]UCZ52225.1 DNA ligase D [Bacillus shivajii]